MIFGHYKLGVTLFAANMKKNNLKQLTNYIKVLFFPMKVIKVLKLSMNKSILLIINEIQFNKEA
ncbi:hypothetical protein BWZ22_14690 [Seonamhaeicola sp. S2-3]|nr:hypothetical protein BWZ22_14690 [Seonamhaeicola sp. S2-3]